MSKSFWKRGEPFVWASGAVLSIVVLFTVVLIGVVVKNGSGVFWPTALVTYELEDGKKALGEFVKREEHSSKKGEFRNQLKIGNRDFYSLDFKWFDDALVKNKKIEKGMLAFERLEYGNFYGLINEVHVPEGEELQGGSLWEQFNAAQELQEPHVHTLEKLEQSIKQVNKKAEKVRLKRLKKVYHGMSEEHAEIVALDAEAAELKSGFKQLMLTFAEAEKVLEGYHIKVSDINGRSKEIELFEIVRAYRPNDMGLGAKIGFYTLKIRELLFDEPRESNTEGGLFPAICGTITLVFLMSLLSFPMGVIAGVYLREYAKDGWMVRLVRIAVNNLAGIPSIVYGVFGLGFFVYGLGAHIDHLFFPERLPTPTYGTGGILWASLTLGLLTVPVVIVATEEAFGAIPRGVREASLAMGATRLQTLMRVLFPMASPGIMTGFILAMARAAGEVAPLMITGVVKLAPALPIDGEAPFFHLKRKFMHLGFHIYDIGFQSPNVEAAKPMVYVTTLLLVLVVLLMTSVAIILRNRMKRKFTIGAF